MKFSQIDPLKRSLPIDITVVYERIKVLAEKSLSNRNRERTISKQFKIGDTILIKKENRVKLDEFWMGPAKIIGFKRNENSVYTRLGERSMAVNLKRVKAYYDRGDGSNFSERCRV